eukprot:TRINITY_DN12277_c0_g1_i2.p1 TRINITY_DN12277_c0_g1~~TRINITY_DN12277_c0_g1_i2.p1  ORF type:complete len:770 (-),score=166.88 TRINITY_DN12277_c0_g1_i2:24-2099(-)
MGAYSSLPHTSFAPRMHRFLFSLSSHSAAPFSLSLSTIALRPYSTIKTPTDNERIFGLAEENASAVEPLTIEEKDFLRSLQSLRLKEESMEKSGLSIFGSRMVRRIEKAMFSAFRENPSEARDFIKLAQTTNIEDEYIQKLAQFGSKLYPKAFASFNSLRNITDLRLPHLLYPTARKLKRKVIYHAGPTNSGKTFQALTQLRQSASGLYCAPLRLLALEIFDNLSESSVATSLITGQERKETIGNTHISCTVEMTDTNSFFSCAVIDEIQMISDPNRGWAWTRAFLGLCTPELHVCGDESAVSLIKKMCELTQDSFELRQYERQGRLIPSDHSLRGRWNNVRKGDAVVVFSRKEIHFIKDMIEKSTGLKCCVVYGGLPPEVRAEQARLFNEPDNGFDVLVASDAIGMGLNLNIKRIVFYTMEKFDGEEVSELNPSQIRQIAGRAGRGKNEGHVTCFMDEDMPLLKWGLEQKLPSIKKAGLLPSLEQVRYFSKMHPTGKQSLSDIMDEFVAMARLDGSYFHCDYSDMKTISDLLVDIPNLTLEDIYNFSVAPVNVQNPNATIAIRRYAQKYARREQIVFDVNMPPRIPHNDEKLRELEMTHQVIDLYLWLSYRFEGHFPNREIARNNSNKTNLMIQTYLSRSASMRQRQDPQRSRAKRRLDSQESQKKSLLDDLLELKRRYGESAVVMPTSP